MRPQLNGATLSGQAMDETRYTPSIVRLIGISAVFVVPAALLSFWGAGVPGLLVAIVVVAASVAYSGRAHSVTLGRDFIEAHGQRVRLNDIRQREALRGFIGDVYASDSARIGLSSIFLSRTQRSEIAERLSAVSKS